MLNKNREKQWKDVRDYLYGPIKPAREPYYTKGETYKIEVIAVVVGVLIGILFTSLFFVL